MDKSRWAVGEWDMGGAEGCRELGSVGAGGLVGRREEGGVLGAQGAVVEDVGVQAVAGKEDAGAVL